MDYFDRKEPGKNLPSLVLLSPSLNVDVRRRGSDPFLKGVVIGAVAAIIGVLIGLIFALPT